MGYPMTLKFRIQVNIIINFKMGKENFRSSKDGLIITKYFNELGWFIATVTPSSAALHTTLFLKIRKITGSQLTRNLRQG